MVGSGAGCVGGGGDGGGGRVLVVVGLGLQSVAGIKRYHVGPGVHRRRRC